MIICLGPICIPLWGLLPLLILGWKKIVEFCRWLVGLPPLPVEVPAESSEGAEGASTGNNADSASTTTTTTSNSSSNDKDGLRQRRPVAKTGTVLELESDEQWAELMAGTDTLPLVVQFTAPWCKPCKEMVPKFNELAAKTGAAAAFARVDIDEFSDTALDCGVATIPAFHVYRNKTKIAAATGSGANLDNLIRKVHSNLI